MVLNKNRVRKAILPLAITSLMFLDGCKKEEIEISPEFTTDLLVGDWILTEVDGEDYVNDYSPMHIKFEASGVVQSCYDFVAYPDDSYCEDAAKWKWEDAKQSAIIITDEYDGDDDETIWDIIILDETKLEGIVIDDTYTTSFKFIRIQ